MIVKPNPIPRICAECYDENPDGALDELTSKSVRVKIASMGARSVSLCTRHAEYLVTLLKSAIKRA